MSYFPDVEKHLHSYRVWLALRREQGHDVTKQRAALVKTLASATRRLARMSAPKDLAAREPDDLESIRALRPKGPRCIPLGIPDNALLDKLHGAWLGRAAGCILGIPCEGMSMTDIRNVCASYDIPYPLRGYWPVNPKGTVSLKMMHYGVTPLRRFLAPDLRYIGADDDLGYTLLGLLILEEYGPEFTSGDVGRAWLKYLPIACTAEKVALDNLRKGLTPPETPVRDNPYTDWIGADIRSDPWGYAAPGRLERAAEFAWRDARVSHRAAGIHSEMFFSAVISAAFAVSDPVEAIRLGLTEIPRNCRTARAARAALRRCQKDSNWKKTLNGICKKYNGMSGVHALNNLEITIAGLYYGKGDFGKTITLTVMGGLDTDCTAATAGSIMGAVLGRKGLPKKWIEPLGNRVETYLTGKRRWKSDAIARRFLRIARQERAQDE